MTKNPSTKNTATPIITPTSARIAGDNSILDDEELAGVETTDVVGDADNSDIINSHNFEAPVSGRLDKILAGHIDGLSRARIQALIASGQVQLNGAVVTDMSAKVKSGQSLALHVPPPVDALPKPENIPLDIIFEDKDVLVINKPIGMVVHPAPGAHSGTLVNALLYHCKDSLSGIGGVLRPGIVHRLDKDTSGLMIVAKNDMAHQHLSAQLAERTLSRVYHAVVWGLPPHTGTIETQIGRHPKDRQKMAVLRHGGREAITHFQLLATRSGAISLIECRLHSGRTHQIRVHLTHLGHPLLGDPAYGRKPKSRSAQVPLDEWSGYLNFPRQALHAKEIEFIHPRTGAEMQFESTYPFDIERLVASISA